MEEEEMENGEEIIEMLVYILNQQKNVDNFEQENLSD